MYTVVVIHKDEMEVHVNALDIFMDFQIAKAYALQEAKTFKEACKEQGLRARVMESKLGKIVDRQVEEGFVCLVKWNDENEGQSGSGTAEYRVVSIDLDLSSQLLVVGNKLIKANSK